jgi:hypothetical protein
MFLGNKWLWSPKTLTLDVKQGDISGEKGEYFKQNSLGQAARTKILEEI